MGLTVGDEGETDARRRLSSCAPPNFNLNAEDAVISGTAGSSEEPVGSANRDWLNLEIDEHSHACLSYQAWGWRLF